jgi:hypothetical protein
LPLRPTPRRLLSAAAPFFLAVSAAHAQVDITSTGQGQVGVSLSGVHELSGITYLGGDQYLLVTDVNGLLVSATIGIDLSTGQFSGTPTLDSSRVLNPAGNADLEAIAFDPRDGSVLVTNERDNSITRYDPANADVLGSISVPSVFSNTTSNRSFEALSLAPRDFDLWTANEEALTVDGPLSSDSAGTVVRLQRFDALGDPAGQYAYVTEPHRSSGLEQARSGVSGLIALPDGRVIIMERELGGGLPTFRIHFFLVDFEDATDTSDLNGLIGETYTAVDKTLLHTLNAGFSNFEGITLGPRLDNGDYALVLVSDDGGGGGLNGQNLTTLRLSGVAMPGDLDGDWAVGIADLDILLAHWGQDVDAGVLLQGDTNGDGTVDQQDLNAVLNHWGDGPVPEVTVPEPTGLLGLGAALFAFKRVR